MKRINLLVLCSIVGLTAVSSCGTSKKNSNTASLESSRVISDMDPTLMEGLKGLYKVADVRITQNGQLIDSRGLNYVSIGFAPLGGSTTLNIRTRGLPGNSTTDGDLNGLFSLVDIQGQRCFGCYPKIYILKSGTVKAMIREISPTTISFGTSDDSNLQRAFLLDRYTSSGR